VPRLIVIKGADAGRQFVLDADLLPAGRDSSSRVRLTDTEASRKHAEFVKTSDGYRVRDLGSANGTFVNNQGVQDCLLVSGDHIQIGQTVLVYTLERGEGPPTGDLANRISLITKQDLELSSAIVKTVSDTEGSRVLAHPEQLEGPWQKNAQLLGVLYEAIQTTSHTLDIDTLLDKILALLFKPIQADRGCVLLRSTSPLQEGYGTGPDPGPASVGEFQPRALRWRDGVRRPKMSVSRTIVDYVLQQKQGILVSDATRDERFQSVQSIVRESIREVICVPMKGRHQTLGVLYLDTTTAASRLVAGGQTGKFSGDHLTLAIAMAHQAALAVEETRYYQAMVNAERLAAIGQTVAALSHDLKNILTGLQLGGQILEEGLRDKDETMLQKGWRLVSKNQGRIHNLVLNMLSYSKEREPNIEQIDLNALVRDVAELMGPRAAEKGAKLELRLTENLPQVPADSEAIHRALLNIVTNAIDAVEECEAGKVLVGTDKEPMLDASRGEFVRIRVRDNGTGIPPEKLGEIFSPFVSTKGAKGTGLGLAVSRKILREHGGDISAESQVGLGSLFTLRLPLRSPLGADASSTATDMPVTKPPTEN
jgi:signal transduction histidine kinase/pSer/pThr/pTyr-binding forkhead associated (FHA) protein